MMKKNLLKKLNKFSFGFEIEGLCSNDLYREIKKEGIWSIDGSVERDAIIDYWDCDDIASDEEGHYWTEFSSNVFYSLSKFEKLLSKFKVGVDYFNDATGYSTGLHFHLGFLQGRYNDLFLLASDWHDIQNLKDYIVRYSQNKNNDLLGRLRSNDYFYRFFSDEEDFKRSVRSGEKYRWVRYHPQGTLEFRFLYPNKNMLADIEELLSFLAKRVFTKEKEIVAGGYQKARSIIDNKKFRIKFIS